MPTLTLNETDLQGVAVDVHANGNTADIKVGNVDRVSVDINLRTLTGGTAPTITFTVQRKDANGNYQPLVSTSALAAVALAAPISVGPGCTTTHALGAIIRIAWVVTGAPTAATADISVQGEN